MIRHRPVAVADRDGFGLPLIVAIAGNLRSPVPILGPEGELLGEVTADSVAHWDPRPSLNGRRVAPVAVRRALATNGRLSAAVSSGGTVICLRVEPRGSTPSGPRAERYPERGGQTLEHFIRPGGPILAVNGRLVRRETEQ